MSSMIETAQKEILRNEILKMCDMIGPQGASEQLIRAGLRKLGIHASEQELAREIDYLKDKGLVDVIKATNIRYDIQRVIVKITALGIDVLEGNADVKGIAEE